jgi:hypothetical protein
LPLLELVLTPPEEDRVVEEEFREGGETDLLGAEEDLFTPEDEDAPVGRRVLLLLSLLVLGMELREVTP